MDKMNIIYDQFKEMENRYHTWMNYYSLFNGALLVAYCTILVSTGQVIEMGGGISTENGITGNTRLFQLECTYWNILTLISFLGCIASYCWYLSAIGHDHWIGRWRKILMEQDNYPKLDFNDVIDWGENKAVHYHSTFKITELFIAVVLLSWIFVCYSSITRDNFLIECHKILYTFLIGVILFIMELIIHFVVGSDLSFLYKEKIKRKKNSARWHIYQKLKDIILIILFIIIFICSLYCCCNTRETNNLEQIKVNIELSDSHISSQ